MIFSRPSPIDNCVHCMFKQTYVDESLRYLLTWQSCSRCEHDATSWLLCTFIFHRVVNHAIDNTDRCDGGAQAGKHPTATLAMSKRHAKPRQPVVEHHGLNTECPPWLSQPAADHPKAGLPPRYPRKKQGKIACPETPDNTKATLIIPFSQATTFSFAYDDDSYEPFVGSWVERDDVPDIDETTTSFYIDEDGDKMDGLGEVLEALLPSVISQLWSDDSEEYGDSDEEPHALLSSSTKVYHPPSLVVNTTAPCHSPTAVRVFTKDCAYSPDDSPLLLSAPGSPFSPLDLESSLSTVSSSSLSNLTIDSLSWEDEALTTSPPSPSRSAALYQPARCTEPTKTATQPPPTASAPTFMAPRTVTAEELTAACLAGRTSITPACMTDLTARAVVLLMGLKAQHKQHGNIRGNTLTFTLNPNGSVTLALVGTGSYCSGCKGSAADARDMAWVLYELLMAACGLPLPAWRKDAVWVGTHDFGCEAATLQSGSAAATLYSQQWATFLAGLLSPDADERFTNLTCARWEPLFSSCPCSVALALADSSPTSATMKLASLPLADGGALFGGLATATA